MLKRGKLHPNLCGTFVVGVISCVTREPQLGDVYSAELMSSDFNPPFRRRANYWTRWLYGFDVLLVFDFES